MNRQESVRPSRVLHRLLVLCILPAAGCAGAERGVPPGPPQMLPASLAVPASAASKIKHVIFVVQENRSFNYLFMGFPGAVTQNYGYDTTGSKIPLHAQTLATTWDLDHSANAFFTACDGTGSLPGTDCKVDGWNKEETTGSGVPKNPAYAYAPRSEVAQYWAMAKQYVLADELFQSNLDGSFVAHQYVVAAYASASVDYPTAQWGCSGGPEDRVSTLTQNRTYGATIEPCFDSATIGDEADQAKVSWKFYAGARNGSGNIWSSYQAVQHIYDGPDWTKDVVPSAAQFLRDVTDGRLAGVTWITPTYANSDHGGYSSKGGPAWVTSVVDAVGESHFWDSSAIFVLWDDWGGFFDPVPPMYADYDGLGFRIPVIMISPYAKRSYVTHLQYETSSVLRFIEDTFGLKPLAASDERAADPAGDAFDFTMKPRPFVPFAGARRAEFWETREREHLLLPAFAGSDGD